MKENCECTYELSRDRIARKGITETLPQITCPPAQNGGNTEAGNADLEKLKADLAEAQKAKEAAEAAKEAAQASETEAIAKADKAKEDLNQALAELVTKQNELTAKDTEIAELKRKLEECQQDKCPEVDVISIGDETVFSGNSCDEIVGLGGDVPAEPHDHL